MYSTAYAICHIPYNMHESKWNCGVGENNFRLATLEIFI